MKKSLIFAAIVFTFIIGIACDGGGSTASKIIVSNVAGGATKITVTSLVNNETVILPNEEKTYYTLFTGSLNSTEQFDVEAGTFSAVWDDETPGSPCSATEILKGGKEYVLEIDPDETICGYQLTVQ